MKAKKLILVVVVVVILNLITSMNILAAKEPEPIEPHPWDVVAECFLQK